MGIPMSDQTHLRDPRWDDEQTAIAEFQEDANATE